MSTQGPRKTAIASPSYARILPRLRKRAGAIYASHNSARQVRELRERGAGDAADPVAELFAWMSRGVLSVRDVGFGFPVAFALLIELVSFFGPLGLATYAAVTRTPVIGNAMASPATPAPLTQGIARIEDHSKGSVVDFVAEETVPAPENLKSGILSVPKHDLRLACFCTPARSGRTLSSSAANTLRAAGSNSSPRRIEDVDQLRLNYLCRHLLPASLMRPLPGR